MPTAASRDGTAIAYDATGDDGDPLVVLVGGGLTDRSENAPLAPRLASSGFRVVNYDRRGRGLSGDDAGVYAVEREIEDLAAVIGDGAPARVFGASSGGALALEAAAAGLPIARVAVYEVPYLIGDAMLAAWREYVPALREALAGGRHGDAVELFMRLAGSSDEDVARARASEHWAPVTRLAPTLAYDAAVLGDGSVPTDRLARVREPVLVAAGAAEGFFAEAADAVAAALPDAERVTLANQGHVADPDVLSAELARFFA